jgi:hypothetical protein
MADNITINSSSGNNTIATDEINGKHYQIVKVVFGDNDELRVPSNTTPIPTSSQNNNLESTQQDIKTQLIQINAKVATETGNLQTIATKITDLLTKYPSGNLNTFTNTSTIINVPFTLLSGGSYQIVTTVLNAGQTGIILVPLNIKASSFSLDVTPRVGATAVISYAFVEQSVILNDISSSTLNGEYWKLAATLTEATPPHNQNDVFSGFVSAFKITATGGLVAIRGGI